MFGWFKKAKAKEVKKEQNPIKCPEDFSPFDPCRCDYEEGMIMWIEVIDCCGTQGLVIRICCKCRKEYSRTRVENISEERALDLANRGLIQFKDWEKGQGKSRISVLMEAAVGNVKYIADRAEGMQR